MSVAQYIAAVNGLWIPAIAMKVPVVLKPGREEPFGNRGSHFDLCIYRVDGFLPHNPYDFHRLSN